ncbi:protein SPMIP7 [Discoglossus pictus]
MGVKQPPMDIERQRRTQLLRQMFMPHISGPEDRHDVTSFQERLDQAAQASFLKFNPQALSPGTPGHCLHPLRDDVPLVDPCSGFISSGADADLRPGTGKNIPSLVDQSDVKPQHTDPWQQSRRLERVRTAPAARSDMCSSLQLPLPANDISQDGAPPVIDHYDFIHKAGRTWNSRERSDAALRASLGGWTSITKVYPNNPRGPNTSLTQKFEFNVPPELKHLSDAEYRYKRDEVSKKYMYMPSTQRAYKEVPLDNKLPPKLGPPGSVLENQTPKDLAPKCCEESTENWRAFGGSWDRVQSRRIHIDSRPVTFMSPFPHKDHIPRYSGCTGAVNIDDVDDPNAEFVPFTKVRTTQPHYMNTSHTPNIPGYTGKVHWLAIHPAHSNIRSASLSAGTKMNEKLKSFIASSGVGIKEEVDNINAGFSPIAELRTTEPYYYYPNTSYTPNIPGYTGKVHWLAIHPAHSNIRSPPSSAGAKMNGYAKLNGSIAADRSGSKSSFNHHGPLSKMITTVSPCNPFNKVDKKIIAV